MTKPPPPRNRAKPAPLPPPAAAVAAVLADRYKRSARVSKASSQVMTRRTAEQRIVFNISFSFSLSLPSEATNGRGSIPSNSRPSKRGPELAVYGEPAMKEVVGEYGKPAMKRGYEAMPGRQGQRSVGDATPAMKKGVEETLVRQRKKVSRKRQAGNKKRGRGDAKPAMKKGVFSGYFSPNFEDVSLCLRKRRHFCARINIMI